MEKKNIYCFIAGVILALLAFAVFSWYTGFGRGNDSSAEVTVNDAIKQNAGAGAAVNNSIRELDGIRTGITETESQLGESAASTDRIAAKSRNSRQLIERCLELNRDAKQLITDLEQSDKERSQESKNK